MRKSRNKPMFENQTIYDYYFNKLLDFQINAIEWENLPSTVDAEFIEKSLITTGSCVFFEDEIIGYLCLKAALSGEMNVYHTPTKYNIYADNGYQTTRDINNSVIIYNNYTRTPGVWICKKYAYLLYQIETALILNLNTQKTPMILRANKNQRLTMENFQLLYETNVPVIRVDEDFDLKNLEVLKLNSDFTADKIFEMKQKVWDEALTQMGYETGILLKSGGTNIIESAAPVKQALATRYTYLSAREKAVKKINSMFGLNISVGFRKLKLPEYYSEDLEVLDGDIYHNNLNNIEE